MVSKSYEIQRPPVRLLCRGCFKPGNADSKLKIVKNGASQIRIIKDDAVGDIAGLPFGNSVPLAGSGMIVNSRSGLLMLSAFNLRKIEDPGLSRVCTGLGFCSVFRPKIHQLHWVKYGKPYTSWAKTK